MDSDLEDLVDSIDSDETDWTRRGVIKMITLSRFFKGQVKDLEKLIEKTKSRIAMFTLASALLSSVGSAGMLVNLITDIVNMYFDENGGKVFRVGILITGFVFNLFATVLIAFLKVKSYEEQLQNASACANRYLKLVNDVGNELYKKAKNRSPMTEFFTRITGEYEKFYNLQTNLGMNSQRLNLEIQELEKRLSTDKKKIILNESTEEVDKLDGDKL